MNFLQAWRNSNTRDINFLEKTSENIMILSAVRYFIIQWKLGNDTIKKISTDVNVLLLLEYPINYQILEIHTEQPGALAQVLSFTFDQVTQRYPCKTFTVSDFPFFIGSRSEAIARTTNVSAKRTMMQPRVSNLKHPHIWLDLNDSRPSWLAVSRGRHFELKAVAPSC